MDSRYAEITGRGAVSCFGLTASHLTDGALSGREGLIDVRELFPKHRFQFGGPVLGFDPESHFDSRQRATLDRFSQFGVVAAREAWADSGLSQTKIDPQRIAVIMGSAASGIDALSHNFFRFFCGGGRPLPTTIPMVMGNATASRIAKEIGAKGPVFAVTSACASSAHAMLLGLMLLRAGAIDIAVVGGSESNYCDGYLRAWDELRVVSPDTCRPFSLGRRGLILGEGAAVIVLERAGAAANRGARIRARLLGGAMNCDAGELMNPDADGMARAMRKALADSGLSHNDVDYVNAHGTGTLANDVAESRALRDLFGERTDAVAISSTKSQIGHALGASGALEAVVVIAALESGIIPPTLNFLEMDPACQILPTPHRPVERDMQVAISNSFAFGGLNVTLVFGRAAVAST